MKKLRIKRVPLEYVSEIVKKAEGSQIHASSQRTGGKVAAGRTPNQSRKKEIPGHRDHTVL
jgi:hypothetical protein